MKELLVRAQKLCDILVKEKTTDFVLFGARPNLASHLVLSPLSHGFGHAPAADSTTCLTSSTLTSKSFVKYPG